MCATVNRWEDAGGPQAAAASGTFAQSAACIAEFVTNPRLQKIPTTGFPAHFRFDGTMDNRARKANARLKLGVRDGEALGAGFSKRDAAADPRFVAGYETETIQRDGQGPARVYRRRQGTGRLSGRGCSASNCNRKNGPGHQIRL